MPKRTAEEKLVRYKRKIKKLEQQQENRCRTIRPFDSSDDETPTAVTNVELQTNVLQDQSDEIQLSSPQPNSTEEVVPLASTSQDEATIPTEVPTEPVVDLDPELLSALGSSTSDSPDFGEPIHDNLAKLWLPLLRKGLPKEEKENLMKVYFIPSNCTLLQAPKLNAEISAAVSDIVKARDKKLVNFQQELGAGTSAVNRAMDFMLKSDNKIQALKFLSDGCRLLTDLHHSLSSDRKKLVIPSLDKHFSQQIQDTERDDTLFGNSLADKIKASKAIEKQGQQIRKFVTNQKVTTSTTQPSIITRTAQHQGNWTGPPRYQYPSNRGGRGGQRKTTSTVRRPYSTTTPQSSSKNYNQSKARANTQP